MSKNEMQVTNPSQNSIVDLLASASYKKQFQMALPKHITPDRFVRIAITALTKTPKLQQCTKESLLSCLVDLSQLGLEPDGRKAHLIPYGNVCTLLVDYKGLVDLAMRSGQISNIHADIVCEADVFEYSFGSEGKLIHKPALSNRGRVLAAYSFVKLKDGLPSYEIMSVDEINAIRERSKAKASGPWVTDWNEMAKKTVFRRHSKWLPLSPEFQEAIEKDIDTAIDITPPAPAIEMPKPKHETTKIESKQEPGENVTQDQAKALEQLAIKYKVQEGLFAFVSSEFQAGSYSDLKQEQYEKAMEWINKHAKK